MLPHFLIPTRSTLRHLLPLLVVRGGLLLLFTTLFTLFALRYLPYSGDGDWVANKVAARGKIVMHAPLTSLIHLASYRLFHPVGLIAWQAVSISSALAGAIALQVYFALRKHPLFLLVNVFSGSFLVFVGQVELYAWVNLFLLLFLLAVMKFLQDEWCLWPAAVFFACACLSHFLALFYLPALFWVMYKKRDFRVEEFLLPFIGFLIFFIGLNLVFEGIGISFGMTRLVPLFEKSSRLHHFTFFSWDHLDLKFFFHLKTTYPILWFDWEIYRQTWRLVYFPIEWPLVFLLRKRIDTPFKQFLLICCLTGLCWTTLWHPDLGPIDWDLFSQMGIPLHVLLGFLLVEDKNNERFHFHGLKTLKK